MVISINISKIGDPKLSDNLIDFIVAGRDELMGNDCRKNSYLVSTSQMLDGVGFRLLLHSWLVFVSGFGFGVGAGVGVGVLVVTTAQLLEEVRFRRLLHPCPRLLLRLHFFCFGFCVGVCVGGAGCVDACVCCKLFFVLTS